MSLFLLRLPDSCPASTERPARAVSPVGALVLGLAALAVVGCSSSSAPAARPPAGVSGSPSVLASAVPTASDRPLPSASPTAAVETAPPLGQPACAAAALTLVDADAVTVGASLEEVFILRTTGPDCQLSGYPALTFTGSDGKALTVQVDHGGHGLPASTPGPVTLSRGTSLSFGVATARTGSCQPTSRVTVALPATTPALSVPTSMQICGGSVGVTPVQRRADSDGG